MRILQNTWMLDGDAVRELHQRVERQLWLAMVEGGTNKRPPPHSVDVLVGHLRNGAKYERWFIVLSACALLGELLWAAENGDIYTVTDKDRTQRGRAHFPLMVLRNTCFHPALVKGSDEGGPAFQRLAAVIKRDQRFKKVAADVLANPSRLHGERVAQWAVARLERAGRYELGG